MLNLKTGHVSPQFHVIFDDEFETVNHDYACESTWQELADLESNRSESSLVDKVIDKHMESPWYKTIPFIATNERVKPSIQLLLQCPLHNNKESLLNLGDPLG